METIKDYMELVCLNSMYYVLFVSYRNLLDGRERAYPNDNYESGDGKSSVWNGHGYYVPHNRSWKKHHEVIKQHRIFSHDDTKLRHHDMCIYDGLLL